MDDELRKLGETLIAASPPIGAASLRAAQEFDAWCAQRMVEIRMAGDFTGEQMQRLFDLSHEYASSMLGVNSHLIRWALDEIYMMVEQGQTYDDLEQWITAWVRHARGEPTIVRAPRGEDIQRGEMVYLGDGGKAYRANPKDSTDAD